MPNLEMMMMVMMVVMMMVKALAYTDQGFLWE